MRVIKALEYTSVFMEDTGAYFRYANEGRDEPFMAHFPELLDIGIMGHCLHGESGLCIKAGVQCYQDGLHSTKPNMSIQDFEEIARQCEGKTFQFALGGCGDPDQHESFKEILKSCRNHKIVPNFTTSGLGMNDDIAALCKECCGAVAVSWYRSDYTLKAIDTLVKHGVKTNIHYVLSNSTMDEALERMKNNTFPENINAVVFLLHKPIGLGKRENCIKPHDSRIDELIRMIMEKKHFKIGFDSCSIPMIIEYPDHFDIESIDTCEGARWSAYITSDMKLLPCSFDNQEQRWAVDLHQYTIEEAWNSSVFEDFRNRMRNACPNCKYRNECMGGCPIVPEIVLCDSKDRTTMPHTFMA